VTLAPLATTADLPAVWSGSDQAARALAVATDAIRDAAGVPITQMTSTVVIDGDHDVLLRLPGPIVRDSVTDVTIDGHPTTDYRVVAEGLWRRHGWTRHGEPAPVEMTFTFGLPVVPADVGDLCVQLAVAWLQHDAAGGGSNAGVQMVRIDDAQEQYTAEGASAVSPVFIPAATRQWLRARFNAGAAVVVGSY